jgi:hypothetical protein
MPTLDANYAPRPWACGECKRILGVVMRNTNRIAQLYVFYQWRTAETLPNKFDLWSRPRGMFVTHGLDWCEGIECPVCGARTAWDLSAHLRERIKRTEVQQKEVV